MHRTLTALDAEWRQLAASTEAARALSRWSELHPALRNAADLDMLLDRRRDPGQTRAVLAALAALAPTDTVAARTLLQAMLPGLVCLAATAGRDDPAAIDEMVSLAWERVRTYPETRRGAVAGNILLDVRKQYRRHRSIEAPRSYCPSGSGPEAASAPSAEDVVLSRLALEDLLRVHIDGTISRADLYLIVRTRLGGESLSEVAVEEHTSAHTLNQRRWRAERRLRQLLAS